MQLYTGIGLVLALVWLAAAVIVFDGVLLWEVRSWQKRHHGERMRWMWQRSNFYQSYKVAWFKRLDWPQAMADRSDSVIGCLVLILFFGLPFLLAVLIH